MSAPDGSAMLASSERKPMTSEPGPTAPLIFGPFQFDASSGEIRKHGMRLRLAGTSLLVSKSCSNNPNQVVAREILQQRLWHSATFVDFNQGLNAAVDKLRQTLGDSADQPRYIETIPGKGYRFIAPVSDQAIRLTGEPQVVADRVGNTRAFGFFSASSSVLVHRSVSPPRTGGVGMARPPGTENRHAGWSLRPLR